jgi:hypothetical protein
MSNIKLILLIAGAMILTVVITMGTVRIWQKMSIEHDADYYIANPQAARDKIQQCLAEENFARSEGDPRLAFTLSQRPECLAAINTKRAWNNYSEYCEEGFDPLQTHLCNTSQ